METTLFTDLFEALEGTFLEEDRDSNFPKENTILSPSAQLIWDAFCGAPICAENKLAAALRAAADQVVPSDAVEPRNYLPMAIECQRIREELLAIADELEGVTYGTYRCSLEGK